MKNSFMILILIAAVPAFATDMTDLRDLAANWLDPYDMEDFADLAALWDPVPDVNAVDINIDVVTYQLSEITLDAGSATQYVVNSKPANGDLYDIFGSSDDFRYGQHFTQVLTMPYRIKSYGKTVTILTEDPNSESFTYYATRSGYTGEAGTVTITKTDYVKDSLCFANAGTVTIADCNEIEFDDSFSFSCWIRPQSTDGTIIKKRGSTGAGLKLYVRAGRLYLEAWNSTGGHGRMVQPEPASRDQWQFVGITSGAADPNDDVFMYGSSSLPISSLPDPPYSNSSQAVIGSRYKGQLDKVNFWPAMSSFSLACLAVEARTEYDGMLSPTNYLAYWLCDEGSGSVIYDRVSSRQAQLNNVLWLPDNRPQRNRFKYHQFRRR